MGGQPFGRRYYWKSDEAAQIDDDIVEELLKAAEAITSPFSAILCMHLDGAPARVPLEATAVGIRQARYGMVFQGAWTEPTEDERHIAWARDYFAAVQPHARDRVYLNFLGDEGPDRVRQAYGAATYDRLARLKRTYDPTNVFRSNQNISPG